MYFFTGETRTVLLTLIPLAMAKSIILMSLSFVISCLLCLPVVG
jgi:hypothetical protein